MNTISKKIEVAANIATIIVALLITLVVARDYLSPSPRGDSGTRPLIGLQPGMRLSIETLDWTRSGKTLLLVLSKGCHFCSESMPFYQRLSKELSDRSRARLVAIFPASQGDGEGFLRDLGVTVDEVKQVPLESIKVPVTPALVLVDNSGTVVNLWVGKLANDKESEVLRAVACADCDGRNSP